MNHFQRVSLAIAAVMAAIFSAGCQLGPLELKERVVGAGPVKTEERDLNDFQQIEMEGMYAATIEVGPEDSVLVEGQQNLLDETRSEVSAGVLKIWSDKDLEAEKKLVVRITVKELDRVLVGGASDMRVEGRLPDEFESVVEGAATLFVSGNPRRLTVELNGAGRAEFPNLDSKNVHATSSGAGKLTLGGKAAALELRADGAGEIDAKGLVADDVTVESNGASNIQIDARKRLTVAANGATSVRYRGTPKLNLTRNGASSVEPIK